MAISTRSSQARATIAASRISTSERKRLQKAVDDIESSIEKYNKEAKSRKKKAGRFASLKKLAGGIAKLSAAGVFGPASPVIGGIAALGSSAAGVQEAKEKKEFLKSAKRIDTSYADPLSNLLFVGGEAKDVSESARGVREEAIAQGKSVNDAADIQALLDIGKSLVLAGQSGSFGGGAQSFLNDPLTGETITLDPDATSFEKLQFAVTQSTMPSQQSIGSYLGGVTPFQRELGGNVSEKLQEEFIPAVSRFAQDVRGGVKNVTQRVGESVRGGVQGVTQRVGEIPQDLQGIMQDVRNIPQTIGFGKVTSGEGSMQNKMSELAGNELTGTPLTQDVQGLVQDAQGVLQDITNLPQTLNFGRRDSITPSNMQNIMGSNYTQGGMVDFITGGNQNASRLGANTTAQNFIDRSIRSAKNFNINPTQSLVQNPFFTDEYLERNRDFISSMMNKERAKAYSNNPFTGTYSLGVLRDYMTTGNIR